LYFIVACFYISFVEAIVILQFGCLRKVYSLISVVIFFTILKIHSAYECVVKTHKLWQLQNC